MRDSKEVSAIGPLIIGRDGATPIEDRVECAGAGGISVMRAYLSASHVQEEQSLKLETCP